MTDKEKIKDAIKNKWMKWEYNLYRKIYYQHFGNYTGCLSYRVWLETKIDLYKPQNYGE